MKPCSGCNNDRRTWWRDGTTERFCWNCIREYVLDAAHYMEMRRLEETRTRFHHLTHTPGCRECR